MILIGVITFSGCETIKVVHVPMNHLPICEFEKFTKEEKASMTEAVGRKIYRNQERCRIDKKRIDDLIDAHNKAHDN